jgi:two-component system, NtrC family, response regulator HydG
MHQKVSVLRPGTTEQRSASPLSGNSQVMRRVIADIDRVACSNASVVITGESGTGKELVARQIHNLSPRCDAPFFGVNCAAIAESLIESELFGHERGSFTGAERRREGCFEAAQGGTLLLDEITEMKPALQAKLLRILEERRLRRIGGVSEINLDVRVLAASNRDLSEAVREGRLREDLFYRLNVFNIHLPPLSERLEDLPLLVDRFVTHFAATNHKNVGGVDDECMDALRAHHWPGNVRQLRNVIERSVIVSNRRLIGKRDLPEDFQGVARVESGYIKVKIGSPLDMIEREAIFQTIKFTNGNRARAAKVLGVSSRTLYNKLQRYATEG